MPTSDKPPLREPLMAEIRFTIVASLHRDYGGANFLHEIVGEISVRNTDDETEETAGDLRAWLVQFTEAHALGFSSRILGDGYSLELSRYWQELFDFDEFKLEIQTAWQTEGSDLLVVRSLQILDRFHGQGIGLAALGRTVDLFSRACDLVACLPEAMEAYFDLGRDSSEPRRQGLDAGHLTKAIALLTNNLIAAGFQRWGDTGLFLLNPTHKRPDILLE